MKAKEELEEYIKEEKERVNCGNNANLFAAINSIVNFCRWLAERIDKTEEKMEKKMTTGYLKIVPQTWQERYNMYMKLAKEDLAAMLAERDKYLSPDSCTELQEQSKEN